MDDRTIAKLHRKFLREPGPTDILTFNHRDGLAEMAISLDTARRQARHYRQTLDQELTLYLAHGILHLAGLNDKIASQRRRMREAEAWLLQRSSSGRSKSSHP